MRTFLLVVIAMVAGAFAYSYLSKHASVAIPAPAKPIALSPAPGQENSSAPSYEAAKAYLASIVSPRVSDPYPSETYKEAVVIEVKPDHIKITHSTGAASIAYADLSPEIRSKYGMTAAAAEQYRAAVSIVTAVEGRISAQKVAVAEQKHAQFLAESKAQQEKDKADKARAAEQAAAKAQPPAPPVLAPGQDVYILTPASPPVSKRARMGMGN